MKRVCHLTSAHRSDDVRIFHKECTSLAANGYEVFLIAQGRSRDENGVHVIGIGTAPASRIKRMTTFARKVYKKALELDCDIYHLHDPELLPYGLALKKYGKKVIFDSHENTLEQMDDKKWIPALIRGLVSIVYKTYASNVFRKLDGLVSVTPHIIDQLKKINSNTWMITNYPIYVELPNKEKQNDKLVLCFTGGISEQWSQKTVLESIDAISNVEYNLCGSGDTGYLDGLRKLPGWKKTTYLGQVSYEKAIALQQKSTVGVALLQPSKNTAGMTGTIGNTKIFEYMMVGLPIICTKFDLWNEIVEENKCGICVSPNDRKAFEAALEHFQRHPEELYKMGENGQEAVRNEYNWKTQEIKLLSLYGDLLNEL